MFFDCFVGSKHNVTGRDLQASDTLYFVLNTGESIRNNNQVRNNT